MPLIEPQQKALTILQPHRTDQSWVAGSVVLQDVLSRPLGDIDVHHGDAEEMKAAIKRDTELLQDNGFFWVNSEHHQFEIEHVFLKGKDVIVINWVWGTPKIMFPLCRNRLLGTHVDVRDAIYQKLLMAFDPAHRKHFVDLADCANGGLLTRSLLNAAARSQQTDKPDEFVAKIEKGIRETGKLTTPLYAEELRAAPDGSRRSHTRQPSNPPAVNGRASNIRKS